MLKTRLELVLLMMEIGFTTLFILTRMLHCAAVLSISVIEHNEFINLFWYVGILCISILFLSGVELTIALSNSLTFGILSTSCYYPTIL